MRRRLLILAGCVVVALLVAWYAGSRFPASAPAPTGGSVRLGPEPGQLVAEYLAALPAQLPPPGPVVPALVMLDAGVPTARAAALVGPLPVAQAVLRLSLPRVQTALRFEAVESGPGTATALDTARVRAALAAAADAARLAGRPGDIAAAEHTALDDPGCPCVVALVVSGDRAALERIAGAREVRAVQAAPPGTAVRDLALSPLLPEQTGTAGPLPDDGPVPARGP